MAKTHLQNAQNAKNDEFYTQYADIQKEVNAYLEFDPDAFRGKSVLLPCDDPEWSNFTKFFAQNFEAFGLKRLVSTSYAFASKRAGTPQRNRLGYWQPTLFEKDSPRFDAAKSESRGKIFVLDRDANGNGRIDIEDLQWSYLDGDGDFRSDEVRRLRDEADVIVTNPPFSLFREFMAWIVEGRKQFLVIGAMNAIGYKEIFPLIMAGKMWLGNGFQNGNAFFRPLGGNAHDYVDGVFDPATGLVKFRNCCWFTNIDHGRRHRPLELMTWAENVKHSRHREIRGKGYARYDNFDAIEVPYVDAIPGDYDGVMGVPISFLDKHCPGQFEIVGIAKAGAGDPALRTKIYPRQVQVDKAGRRSEVTKLNDGPVLELPGPTPGETYYEVGGKFYAQVYARILIRMKRP
ncbi:MAG: adenine-specific methyltransferase EcoRI family protein [Kiritimatiellae bacterium]|nr:adenine-specific methyltransferase EcoRI family protein [Kiritimatiellia bacterium]